VYRKQGETDLRNALWGIETFQTRTSIKCPRAWKELIPIEGLKLLFVGACLWFISAWKELIPIEGLKQHPIWISHKPQKSVKRTYPNWGIETTKLLWSEKAMSSVKRTYPNWGIETYTVTYEHYKSEWREKNLSQLRDWNTCVHWHGVLYPKREKNLSQLRDWNSFFR